MKWLSLWRNANSYKSCLWFESKVMPGVRYSIKRISLAQRLDLSVKVRELSLNNEYLRSGDLTDTMLASEADLLVEQLYLQWALAEIHGLSIDGQRASTDLLLEKGPEELVHEIACAIHSQLELSDAERKN